jgi:hypothetical protein
MRRGAIVVIAGLLAGCAPRTGAPTAPAPPTTSVPIMAASRLSSRQLIAWFDGRQPRPPGAYAATEPLEALAAYFIEEGSVEGVTGDVAFIQSVVETGWFRFTGIVPPSANNFSGLGATGAGSAHATFANARTGVRAQIQHLRAYADVSAVTCSVPPLHSPCVDPRFAFVSPKGKAATWNQMGNGNWAASSTYAQSILTLYEEARIFSGSTVSIPVNRRAAGSSLRRGG